MNRRMCFLDEEVSVILGGGRNKSLKTQQKTQQKTRSKTKRKRWMQKQIWMKKKPQSILKQTKMNGKVHPHHGSCVERECEILSHFF